jgi:hypothetical protein
MNFSLTNERNDIARSFIKPGVESFRLHVELQAGLSAGLVVGLAARPKGVREILLGGIPVPTRVPGVPHARRPEPIVHLT